MADDPTLGEMVRRMEAGFSDLKEDLRDLAVRLDSRVSMERYQLEQRQRDESFRALLERVKGAEDARVKAEQQRAVDRRLILTALVAPLLLILLQAYLTASGARS